LTLGDSDGRATLPTFCAARRLRSVRRRKSRHVAAFDPKLVAMKHHLPLAGISLAGTGLTFDPAACTRGRQAVHRVGDDQLVPQFEVDGDQPAGRMIAARARWAT
jgi:hypothetical protein